MIVVGGVIDTMGNLGVIDAIGDATWNDADAGRLGPALPGFDEGHELAGLGMTIVTWAAIAFAAVMALTRNVHPVTALASAAVIFVFPPWLAPGFGLIVLVVALLRRKNRLERRTAPSLEHELTVQGLGKGVTSAQWVGAEG